VGRFEVGANRRASSVRRRGAHWSPFIMSRTKCSIDHSYSIDYTLSMFTVKRMPQFDAWFDGLRDGMTKCRLMVPLRKAQIGNLGDVKPVGEGVFEMREHFGPGWRMYYAQRGLVLIVMLGEARSPHRTGTSLPPRDWKLILRSDAR
jgi:putative addiction module killer protein